MTTMPSYEEYGNHPPVFPEPVDQSNAGLPIPEETRLQLFRVQQEIRQFEKRAYDMFLQGLVKGTSHLSLGQEAIAAGFGVAMREDDWTFATYRGHAHTLARGVPMTPVLAELLGRKNGLMGGKGGSMHLTSVEHGVMGSYAIIGAHLCVANGAAWTSQFNDTGQVAVADDLPVLPGDQAEIRFDLDKPVGIGAGIRFALGEGGKTVGAGIVTEVTA